MGGVNGGGVFWAWGVAGVGLARHGLEVDDSAGGTPSSRTHRAGYRRARARCVGAVRWRVFVRSPHARVGAVRGPCGVFVCSRIPGVHVMMSSLKSVRA